MTQRVILKKEPRLDAKHVAFPYQAEAIDAIRELPYAAIFHEQGLGKSKIAIDLMLHWLNTKAVDTILLVAKKSLLRNWEKEFVSHSFIKPKILTQDRRTNFYVFNSPSRLILTHYEVLNSENARLQLFLKARNVAVILDESTKLKNPQSSLTKAAFKLAPHFAKRVIMTGTPVANRPYDIWAQIWFLDQGQSLGNDFLRFKRGTDLRNDLYENEPEQVILERTLEAIFAKIAAFTVRETKNSGVISLPEKVIHSIATHWETTQYDLYRQVRNDMRAVVIREGIPTEDSSTELLKRLLRLVQIASNPRLIDEGYHATPGKYEYLLDLIAAITNNREKCIVWTTFTDNVDWLARELKTYNTCKVHGKMSIQDRNRAIEKFLGEETASVFIATPGAAKEGLTLTVANHVIFYDRGFSLDDYLQAQDRIHRISQLRTCHVYNLIMEDSIDEWIAILLQSKHLAAQLVQGDITLDYYQQHMSYDFGQIVRRILNIEEA